MENLLIERLSRVKVKKDSVINGYAIDGKGDFYYQAGRTYTVIVEQHYIDETRNQIHWVGRKSNYLYTDIDNIII